MSWLKVVILLLQLVTTIVRSRSDKEQQEIGKNELVRQQLAELAVRTQIARKIDLDSEGWDREHIDRILHDRFRD